MLDRISIDLSNYCSKQCDFCYNHSTKEGNVMWTVEELIPFVLDLHKHGIDAVSFGGGEPFEFDGIFNLIFGLMDEMYVSVTSNGLPLENAEVFAQLIQNKPDKVHITIHHPENTVEVDRVIAMVKKIAAEGIKSGVNLLVSDFNCDKAKDVYNLLIANGITADRIILIPRRFTCEPTPKQLSEIAGGKPFQSPACLTGCKQPTEFCSLSWDKKVNWCSYASGKQPLKELTFNGLMDALNNIVFGCCKNKYLNY
ncbi:MAG: radical SAM protein [Spirochaetales bacterium]|nr:radical SAM protein [Spirochaetales bacterium]